MDLFSLFFAVKVKDEASNAIAKLSEKLGIDLKNASAIGLASVGAAFAGITALTKKSLDSYAEYEQLVGGAETLFKDSSDTILEYADKAYMTAGVSANQYLSTVTNFSASLLQSLDGDTQEAAELANQTLIDISDNVNKLGNEMSMVQNAYQGFAKGNYTMLDNLKLGYGGTRNEMKRLIKDAAKLDESIDKSSLSFDNVVKAIHVIQNEMGITGATASEAATTIEGSANMTKAALENLWVAFAAGNGKEQEAFENLMSSVETLMGNVFPRIGTILTSMASIAPDAAAELIDKMFENLPAAIDGAKAFGDTGMKMVASIARDLTESAKDGKLLSAGIDLVLSLLTSFSSAEVQADILIAVTNFAEMLIYGVNDSIPMLVQAGLAIVGGLTGAIIAASPDISASLVRATIDSLWLLASLLISPKNIKAFADGSVQFAYGIFDGFRRAVISVTDSTREITNAFWNEMTTTIKDPGRLVVILKDLFRKSISDFMEYTGEIGRAFWDAELIERLIDPLGLGFLDRLINRWRELSPKLYDAGVDLFDELKNGFMAFFDDSKQMGTEFVQKLKDGIKEGLGNVKALAEDLFGGSINISLPNINAAGISNIISGSHQSGLARVPYDGYIAELHEGERVLTRSEAQAYNSTAGRDVIINVNIEGAQYDSEERLAEAVASRLQRLFEDEAAIAY